MVDRFLEHLRATHALEFRGDHGAATHTSFDGIRDDLLRTFAEEFDFEESAVVDALEKAWPALVDAAFAGEREFDGLLARLETECPFDPLLIEVDLLGVVGRARDEIVHTRVLAALMDPGKAGKLGGRLIRAFMAIIEQDLATLDEDVIAGARVAREEQHRMGGRTIIPDLVIYFRATTSGERIVVIENKIGVTDHKGQLDKYRRWATSRGDGDDPVLVYLTPHGAGPVATTDPNERAWKCLSYARIAEAWRTEMRLADEGPWKELLRLYLGTVLRHVLGRTLPADSKQERALLVPYLRAAVGLTNEEVR